MDDGESGGRHIDRVFEGELRALRESITLMAGRVELMIAGSVRALMGADVELAGRIIAEDARVNRAELEIDELCLLLLAKRQPVAGDLRFITFTLKMVTDLERVADLAVNIAERVRDLQRDPPSFALHDGIGRMTEIVQSMISDAIDSFVQRDIETAQSVIDSDDEIDALYHKVFGDLLRGLHGMPEAGMRALIHVMSVAKWLERMGDHAVNVAELVIFMVNGDDVRHLGKRGLDDARDD
ncbi:MAG: phosphate signaling complex protein PhoU [Myxococcales bacterium]|nr:phosphate signaling complex protein PhoU [Myxococcales bacterium]MCB9749793.1 phosphate signaling complex protein PhoU [Myxococcales bacterium]